LKHQGLSLDRLVAYSYIAACALAAAACPGRLAPLVTSVLVPSERAQAVAWAGRTVPRHDTAIRFRFQYRDSRKQWVGRGTARVAPPDSLRFDYVGPLGLGAGAAVVVGDSEIWADPEENFRALVPAVRMLWAGLGVVRPPGTTATVSSTQGAAGTTWRFAEGADTIDYVAFDGAPRTLEAEWRREGKVVARSRTELDAAGQPTDARILFPQAPAHFELTIVGIDTTATIAPTLWRSRR